MDLTLPQPVLARGLAQVSRAVAPSTQRTLPILGDVLLQAQPGWLALSATNLDLALIVWVPAEVAAPGAAAVPGRLFSEVVAAQPAEPVRLAHGDEAHALTLSCGRSRCAVRGHNPAEFPLLPQIDPAGGVAIPSAVLRTLIAQAVVAAATDHSRPLFTGVLATYEGTRLTFVATDGVRLAIAGAPLATAGGAGWSAIIPARTLAEVARVIPDEAATVTLCLAQDGGQILFHTDYVRVISRLIEGPFVDYGPIVPQAFTYRAVVDTGEWRRTLRTAALFARPNNNIIRLVLNPATNGALGTLRMAAAATDVGDNVCDVDAVIEGAPPTAANGQADTPSAPLTVAFNVSYIADALTAIKAEQVALDVSTASAPGLIRPLDGSDYQYLLMPMDAGA